MKKAKVRFSLSRIFLLATLFLTSLVIVPFAAGQMGGCVTGQEAACLSRGSALPPNAQQVLMPSNYSEDNSSSSTPPSTTPTIKRIPHKTTEFEQMVADSIGRKLPIYGLSLFESVPNTFAPLSKVPVPTNYVIGPGDEVSVRIWGPVNLNVRSTVDRNGQLYIPQVGNISLAGVQYSQLEERLRTEISHVFKNFQLSASLGQLRAVQIFALGEAANPGQYTVGSMSTLVDALFATGGPTANGSLRHIQLKRGAQIVTELDLYDMLVHGDRSKDVPIQPGDVIFFPPNSGYVAVAGSVNSPAIFEVKSTSTLASVIEDAGGTNEVADNEKVSIERIDGKQARSVTELSLTQARDFRVQKGDIIRVLSLVPRFDNTVVLRGNVTNPGRYAWKPGMTVRDLIPNPSVLLTRSYWMNQANLTNGRSTEYPIRPPASAQANSMQNGAQAAIKSDQAATPTPQAAPNVTEETITEARATPNEWSLTDEVRQTAPEVNWDYALVQRVNPVDLTTKLIPFSLAGALIEKDEANNLPLESGDIVTIFSQRDIAVPQDRRTQFIKLEGEIRAPGLYSIGPQDTLQSMIERAGGLTSKAYLFGSQLTRVSVQEEQQKSLDEFVRLISVQMQQTMAAAANGNPEFAGQIQGQAAAQQQMVAAMKSLRAPGRIILQLGPNSEGLQDVPQMALEDGDRFIVPHRPAVVSVIGAVYNQGSFVYNPKRRVKEYFDLAGRNTPIADKKNMFIIRADGTVISSKGHSGVWKGSFEKYRMSAGDTLVVPSKLATGVFERALKDWTQIFSQIALTATSVAILAKQ